MTEKITTAARWPCPPTTWWLVNRDISIKDSKAKKSESHDADDVTCDNRTIKWNKWALRYKLHNFKVVAAPLHLTRATISQMCARHCLFMFMGIHDPDVNVCAAQCASQRTTGSNGVHGERASAMEIKHAPLFIINILYLYHAPPSTMYLRLVRGHATIKMTRKMITYYYRRPATHRYTAHLISEGIFSPSFQRWRSIVLGSRVVCVLNFSCACNFRHDDA